MPKQTGSVLGKIAGAVGKAVANHAKDETKYGEGGSLPPGIENGVAKLVDCRFSQYEKGANKGQPFFLAVGVVQSPETHDGVRIVGRRTMIMEPLCETPSRSRKTIDDHVAWVMNEMRKLGAPTEDIGDASELEELAKTLKMAQPSFRFRTWIGEKTEQFPNPRVNEVWEGATEHEDEPEGAVEDESVDETEEETVEPEEEAAEEESGDDLDALASAADEGDAAAGTRLTELAMEAGLTKKQIDGAKSWAALVEQMGEGDSEPAAKAAPSSAKIAKGDIYFYRPKGAKKAVEVEVTAVNAKSSTADVVSLDDKKAYKGVAFNDLKDG